MVSLNDALMDLVLKKLVEPAEAYAKAVDKPAFDALLKRNNINLSVPADPKKPAGVTA
jgi:twitching motility protein PilT